MGGMVVRGVLGPEGGGAPPQATTRAAVASGPRREAIDFTTPRVVFEPMAATNKKAVPTKKASAKPKRTSATKKASAWSSHPIIPTSPANEKLLAKLRAIALALPGAAEALNHGRPCFSVRDKTFVMFLDNHHRDGRVAIWCKAPPGAQSMITEGDPERYFIPPYVGKSGWIGARLDRAPDWAAIRALVAESYAMTAKPARRAR